MRDVQQAFLIAGYNFKKWKKNPRVIITFVLAFVLCLMLSDKVVAFARTYDTALQVVEVFVWTFGDANSIMLSSLLLIFLFADMPFVTAGTPYILYRTKRKVWIGGQILYVIGATFLYVIFLLAVTCLICAPESFVGNQWSDTAAMLGYSGVGAEIAIPASVKAMESTLPYQCAAVIFLLLMFYAMMTATLMMVLNLGKSTSKGVLGVFVLNVYGLLLSPQIFQQLLHLPTSLSYKANLAVGWLSPLNHATYYMHNLGYDYLPRIWMSLLLFSILIMGNLFLAGRRMKRYEFNFLQMEE